MRRLKVNDFIKMCPDLTVRERVEPILVGQGAYERPVLKPCLLDRCAAFKPDNNTLTGTCLKYGNFVYIDMKKVKEKHATKYMRFFIRDMMKIPEELLEELQRDE